MNNQAKNSHVIIYLSLTECNKKLSNKEEKIKSEI